MNKRGKDKKDNKNKTKKTVSKKNKGTSGIVWLKNQLADITTQYDFTIFLLVLLLSGFGIIMVFSAGYYTTTVEGGSTYYYLVRQGFWVVTGFVIMVVVTRIDYHVYSKWYKAIAFISIVLLLLVFTPLGVTVNGASRWINLGFTRITPSEFTKLFMIVFTSAFIAENPARAKKLSTGILPVVVIMLIQAGLIVKQPNLSTAIVVCAIMVGILFIGGLGYGWLGLGAGAMAVLTFYILNFAKESHWYSRLTSFTNPFKDAQGDGYQVTQSLIALGNGGFKGLGLGNSIAKNLYLPEPQNDFILAVIGEELGFIGIIALMCVYLFLIYKCAMVAANASDKLGCFLASGVTIMLALQVIINVAVVTSSMPATGITLPFVSYGGTSIWVFMAAMGILLNVSSKKGDVQ